MMARKRPSFMGLNFLPLPLQAGQRTFSFFGMVRTSFVMCWICIATVEL